MKLIGHAGIWWKGVEHDLRINGQPLISNWEDMKLMLMHKYLTSKYPEPKQPHRSWFSSKSHDIVARKMRENKIATRPYTTQPGY